MVDDEDYEELKKFNWYDSHGYATCNIKQENGSYKHFRMSRMLMKAKVDDLIDHIDRNKLNNQKSNLRFANKSINSINRNLQKSNKSGFRGVHFDSHSKKWRAEIHHYDKHIRLGRFSDIKDAAIAYNDKAKELFGEFAYLNKI